MVLLVVEYTASIGKNGGHARMCIDPNTLAEQIDQQIDRNKYDDH